MVCPVFWDIKIFFKISKLKINNYIVASFLSHIAFFCIFMLVLPRINTDASPYIFKVDIVSPAEEKIVPETLKSPEKLAPVITRKRKESKIPPKTMFGDNTESDITESDKKENTIAPNITEDEIASSEGPDETLPEPKSFLFDKGTIEKYASRSITTKGKGLTFDAPEFHHRGYMRRLKDKIENIWRYPGKAARRRISGDLYIRFSIKKDGSLGKVELVRTSGYQDLDEAAMKALEDAGPYWPLPADFKDDELTIKGHFIYVIGRFYPM